MQAAFGHKPSFGLAHLPDRSSAGAEVQASLRQRLLSGPKLPPGFGRLDGKHGKRQDLTPYLPYLFVLILTAEITASQQAELDEAKRTHRPILIIRGIPLEIDPALVAVVDVPSEAQVAQGPIYAKAPMREWR